MVAYVDQPLLQEQGGNFMVVFGVFIRGFATFLLACTGAILAGTVTSMAYPGWGAIAGAAIGFALVGVLSCFCVGFWRDVLPEEKLKTINGPLDLLPNAVAEVAGGRYAFDLALTIERCEDAQIRGYLITSPGPYIEITCGANPRKSTCVKKDFVWNEVFRLQVTRKDENITLTLMDQDMFGSTKVGTVNVHIQEDIMEKGFPKTNTSPVEDTHFAIHQEGHDTLYNNKNVLPKLVLSFEKLYDVKQSTQNLGQQAWGDQEDQLNQIYETTLKQGKAFGSKGKHYGSTTQS